MRLTGGSVFDEEADHVTEWRAPLGDTGGPPQRSLLHGLGTGEAVERQVVLLLEELLGPWSEACEQGQHSGSLATSLCGTGLASSSCLYVPAMMHLARLES